MGKRRICCTPVDTLTFVLTDKKNNIEKEVDFTFNNYALILLINEFGNIQEVFAEYDKKPYDTVSILLYCGVKPNNFDFTLEEAREIVAGGGSAILEEITKAVTDSFLTLGGNEVTKKFIEEMEKQGMKEVALDITKNFR